MTGHTLRVALISDVFFDDPDGHRFDARLQEARQRGAQLALLPELPLDPWCPMRRDPRDEDAEPPSGPRQLRMADAARRAGVALIGGAIIRSPSSGIRHNTALVYDSEGKRVGAYRKLHLPAEEGFWETRHYEPGSRPPEPVPLFGCSLGLQICSDAQRPQGTYLLAAAGADAVLVPRSTEATTWSRWRTVLQANAMTAGVYVLSVNRPRPEGSVALGGPSLVVGPDGTSVLETMDPIAVVELDRRRVREARRGYPGYLATRADLYAEGWARVAAHAGPEED